MQWNESGEIRAKGSYMNNEKEGDWVYWYANGLKKTKAYYRNGVLFSGQELLK